MSKRSFLPSTPVLFIAVKNPASEGTNTQGHCSLCWALFRLYKSTDPTKRYLNEYFSMREMEGGREGVREGGREEKGEEDREWEGQR